MSFTAKVYPSANVIEYSEPAQSSQPKRIATASKSVLNDKHTLAAVAALESTGASQAGGVSPVGLVNVTNWNANLPKRLPRGLTGITKKGRIQVREALFLLERDYGFSRLSFLTLTIPNLKPKTMARVLNQWSKVVKAVIRSIKTALAIAKLPTSVVAVTEVQPKRLASFGEVGLHVHLVFVGRHAGRQWAISTKDTDRMWSGALSTHAGHKVLTDTACTIKPVTKSPIAELSKYMSKGAQICKDVIEAGLERFLPSSWWSITNDLRAAIKEGTIIIRNLPAEVITAITTGNPLWMLWRKVIEIELPSAYTWPCAVVGKLTEFGYSQLLQYHTANSAT